MNRSTYTQAARLARTVGAAALAAPLGWLAYSALFVNHHLPLPPALPATREELSGPETGRVSFYIDRGGAGRPLVLIHSINAGASAYEMRPIFERYRGRRPVFVPDLPGFGFSERSDRVYSPDLYTAAVIRVLEIAAADGPADVVALSLGGEFAARAALRRPELVASLALISPTGFARRPAATQARSNRPRAVSRAHRVLSFPLWAQALYDLLVTKPIISFFLKQSFAGPVPRDLLEYDYLTTHQPGARFAPLYFISGALFSPDIRETVYAALPQPALVLYDTASFVSFDELPGFVARHPHWETARIAPARDMAHWEQPDAVAAALERFWERSEPRATRWAGNGAASVDTDDPLGRSGTPGPLERRNDIEAIFGANGAGMFSLDTPVLEIFLRGTRV